MDADSTTTSHEQYYQELLDQNVNNSRIDGLDRATLGCGLCGRSMSHTDEVNGIHQNDSICDDCKFLLIEDFGTLARSSNRRRLSRRVRPTSDNSDLSENLFSQRFSQIISLARQVDPGLEEFFDDVDSNSRLPDGSRRWRRIISETESDVSNSDSNYGESESNISNGAYYHGDSDALSFSTYEGDSDTSVDGRTFFNTDIVQSVDVSDLDSDSDIDPMHAGNVQWDFDDHEQVEGYPESSAIARNINDINLRISRGQAAYRGDPGNYLDAQGFEDFLEHIADIDSSRRGAPPASTSFVNNLPAIFICEEHQKTDGLACAICKDLLTIGTEVNQLPCLHLYHPFCIIPWLRTRNTCPLCRYDLPIDDTANDHGMRITRRMVISALEHQDDSSSIMSDSSEMDEFRGVLEDVGPVTDISRISRGRRGWFLFAAAPIVSLMGLVFVLWLGNPLAGGRQGQIGQSSFHCRPTDLIQTSNSCPRNARGRRWWWF